MRTQCGSLPSSLNGSGTFMPAKESERKQNQ
jgi:hypothetical protein